MTLAAEKLVNDIKKLPLSDRASLAHLIIESLDSTHDDNVDQEWQAVISKRSQDIKNGSVKCRSSFDVIDEIRDKIKNVSTQSS